MAAKPLRLRYAGDPVLRKKAKLVKTVDARIQGVIDKMFVIMEEAKGVGLAAPQVGLGERVIVVDTRQPGEQLALVNPRITWRSPEKCRYEEGCLSVPEVTGEVERPEAVNVEGLGRDGRPVKLKGVELLARVLQHEIDHLDGKLFIDRLSPEDQERVAQQVKEIENFTPGKRKLAPMA